MSRPLDASTISALNGNSYHFFHLFSFEFATPFYITDHTNDLTYGGNTYLSSGRLLGFSAIKESTKIANPKMTIILSGANSADITLPLTENYNNVPVVIYRGLFDSSGNTTSANLNGTPWVIWDGRISSWSIDDDPIGGTSAITWEVSSHWADWEKVVGRKCNNEDAQHITDSNGTPLFPNEQGFSHVNNLIGDVTWGRIRTGGS